MVLDEQKTGIPIGLIVFTAKADAKAVHADYNTQLIRSLLEKWRQGLGTMGGNQLEFPEPQVATTDYDMSKLCCNTMCDNSIMSTYIIITCHY